MLGGAGSFLSSFGYNSLRSNRLDHPEPADVHRVTTPTSERKFSPNENYLELHDAINKLLDKSVTICCLPRQQHDRRWFDIMNSFDLSKKQVHLLIKLVERQEATRLQALGLKPEWQHQESFYLPDIDEPSNCMWGRPMPPLPAAPALSLPALPALPRYSAIAIRREGNRAIGTKEHPGPRIRSSNHIREAYRNRELGEER